MPVKPIISHPIDHQGLASCILAQRRQDSKCANTRNWVAAHFLHLYVLAHKQSHIYIIYYVGLASVRWVGSAQITVLTQKRINFHFYGLTQIISYIIYQSPLMSPLAHCCSIFIWTLGWKNRWSLQKSK